MWLTLRWALTELRMCSQYGAFQDSRLEGRWWAFFSFSLLLRKSEDRGILPSFSGIWGCTIAPTERIQPVLSQVQWAERSAYNHTFKSHVSGSHYLYAISFPHPFPRKYMNKSFYHFQRAPLKFYINHCFGLTSIVCVQESSSYVLIPPSEWEPFRGSQTHLIQGLWGHPYSLNQLEIAMAAVYPQTRGNQMASWLSHWTRVSKIQLNYGVGCCFYCGNRLAAEIHHVFNLSHLFYILLRGRHSLFMNYVQSFSWWDHDLGYMLWTLL